MSGINYKNAVQNFSNATVARIQTRPDNPTVTKGTLNYAILRLHQEAVWMKLGLYTPAIGTRRPHTVKTSPTINILIDTGAALSLIKEEIISSWKELYPQNVSLQETTQRAETCSGTHLQITHKCRLYNCCLSGGPSLTLEFFVCKNLFCDAILGLPEMRARVSSIDLRSFVFRYALTNQDPGFKRQKIGNGITSPIIPRAQKPIRIGPLGKATVRA